MDSSPGTTLLDSSNLAVSVAPAEPRVRFWVVPHTHWDREWYMPFQVFRIRLARMVDDLMDTLESDPNFSSFTLDGQAVVLEDYLAARPGSEERLSRLIREGRIRIGPSYVLPDEYLVGQESLVRNLLLGRQVCRRYGPETPVAYYPDTFGHVAQMPQIARGFGMESFVFWRGLGEAADNLGSAFRWQGPDGSQILAIRQLDGYGSANRLGRSKDRTATASDPERSIDMAHQRLRDLHRLASPYLERSDSIELLACNGTDHQPVQANLPGLLAACTVLWPDAEFRIGDLQQFAGSLMPGWQSLATYAGEMCEGKDAPVLRGVNSTRMPLKQRNEAVERTLMEAEVASSLAYLAGADYPTEELRMAWFHLLRDHPHDSICGCSVDEVHRDMAWRFDAAEHIAVRLRREALWKLAGGTAIWSYRERPNTSRTAVNLLPWRRGGVVQLPLPAELSKARSLRAEGPSGELPVQILQGKEGRSALVAASADGFGAAPIRLSPGRCGAEGARISGERSLENEHYRVEVLPNGTLDILHRVSGRRITGAHWLEDEADRGDEYTFCPVEGGRPWDSRGTAVKVRPGMKGPAAASLILEMGARLPVGLTRDRMARARAVRSCPIRVEVRLAAGAERVEFRTCIDNRCEDHRLRVVVPAPRTDGVRVEGHYAVLRRGIGAPDCGPNWAEPPAATHHTLGAVEAAGVALFGRGLPEYEARRGEEGTEIALTLLRSVGWLSRDDLTTRHGHAGPPLPTPEAQCLGQHHFEYALALVDEVEDAELIRRSQDYRFGLLAGPAGVPEKGPLQLDGDHYCLAALKGAEDGDGCILRVFNPSADRVGSLQIGGGFQVAPCRLDEEDAEREPSLGPSRIASFRLRRPVPEKD